MSWPRFKITDCDLEAAASVSFRITDCDLKFASITVRDGGGTIRPGAGPVGESGSSAQWPLWPLCGPSGKAIKDAFPGRPDALESALPHELLEIARGRSLRCRELWIVVGRNRRAEGELDRVEEVLTVDEDDGALAGGLSRHDGLLRQAKRIRRDRAKKQNPAGGPKG